MAVTGNVVVQANIDEVLTGDLGVSKESPGLTGTWTITSGTGANQADKQWSDTRSLTTGANEDLDLAGVLTSVGGAVVTFVKLKAILIVAAAANTTNLTVSRPATNGVPFFAAASDAIVLKPGGFFAFCDPSAAGVTVTAATGDLINIANAAGATASYSVVLVGTSA